MDDNTHPGDVRPPHTIGSLTRHDNDPPRWKATSISRATLVRARNVYGGRLAEGVLHTRSGPFENATVVLATDTLEVTIPTTGGISSLYEAFSIDENRGGFYQAFDFVTGAQIAGPDVRFAADNEVWPAPYRVTLTTRLDVVLHTIGRHRWALKTTSWDAAQSALTAQLDLTTLAEAGHTHAVIRLTATADSTLNPEWDYPDDDLAGNFTVEVLYPTANPSATALPVLVLPEADGSFGNAQIESLIERWAA